MVGALSKSTVTVLGKASALLVAKVVPCAGIQELSVSPLFQLRVLESLETNDLPLARLSGDVTAGCDSARGEVIAMHNANAKEDVLIYYLSL